jgi:hypothetical protein
MMDSSSREKPATCGGDDSSLRSDASAGIPKASAILSDDGVYRWRLERGLGRIGPTAALIGVNPSTADAAINDQTIRKDMGFGARLGWGRIIKGNKFGYRATDVTELRRAHDPIGPDNDAHLRQIMADADIVVACWGPLAKLPPHLRRRWYKVCRIADEVGRQLWCFGTAQDGQPRHTLMLAYDTPLMPWTRP